MFMEHLFREDAVEKEKRFAQLNYSETINYIVSISVGLMLMLEEKY